MKEVQTALATVGVPVYALAWRPTANQPTAPNQYIVYTTMVSEDTHRDDALVSYSVYVYLNIWSKQDPTALVKSVRQLMRAADFALVEERDSYEGNTDTNCVASTWLLRKYAADE